MVVVSIEYKDNIGFFVYVQVPSPLDFFNIYMYIIIYQTMYALTSFREWSVPDSGSPHYIRQGCAACIGGCPLHIDTDYTLDLFSFFYI